jgi:predicted acylesterase/phospholipase RssA
MADPVETISTVNSGSAPFQVLALDGGGLKGIFATAVLAFLEDDLGHPIVEHFDLICGTSSGGIIALGLGAGLTPRQLVDFYVDKGADIFPGASRWTRSVRQLFRSKYRSANLQEALQEVFGGATLAEASKRLLVPSFNIDAGEVYIFKTAHHLDLRRDHTVPLWQVAMATCAAPTYLPSYCLPKDRVRLVDGGVWANNPVVLGIAEAVSMLGVPLGSVRVLSIGTSSEVVRRKDKLDEGGLLRWAGAVVDVLLRGQSIGAHGLAQHLVGKDNVLRVDPIVPPKALKLDVVNADDLIAMAANHSRKWSPRFFDLFTDHYAPPFTSLYTPQVHANGTGLPSVREAS